MKKTVWIAVFMLFLLGIFNVSYSYSDINSEYWAYEAINSLNDKKILSGYPDGTFKPDSNMSRAEFITILMKILEPNADVSSASEYWADGSLRLAKEKNIILKDDYYLFEGDKAITRREICLMIYRSFKELDTIDIAELDEKKQFLDVHVDNKEEVKITAILSHIGVLSGYLDNTVRLNDFSSRAETCCFIDNFLKYRCKLLSIVNDNMFVAYENDIATVNISKLPYSLKKLQYAMDIPYVTTEIKSVEIFPFNNPTEYYKSIFNDINTSEDRYMEYRRKFGEGKYVIAIEFESTNNTNQCEIYAGSEFLNVSFPDEEISIIDIFDMVEIKRQLDKNADIGSLVLPGQTLNTSAFYVIDKLPCSKIRIDRSVLGIYDIKEKQHLPLTSFHSLVIKLRE